MTNISHYLFSLCVCFSFFLPAAGQSWSALENSPFSDLRHDDVFFINPDTGWIVNVSGYIYATEDGGNNWVEQVYQPETSFRCVGFANQDLGWAGNLGPGNWSPTSDTIPLYHTENGGATWTPVESIDGPLPEGICGIHVLDDSVIHAVGRVRGPTYFMRSTDGGESWTSTSMDSLAYSLIDCYFFSRDTGILVGSTAGEDSFDSKSQVLYTTDGGESWNPQFIGSQSAELCWKISFPSPSAGYISVENLQNDTTYFLSTHDRGVTWEEKLVPTIAPFYQGIGFINDSVGWIGYGTTYTTADGGNSWTVVPFVPSFNRFRKINDTLAYAVGKQVWKYTNESTGWVAQTPLKGFELGQNYPNPFSEKTTIEFSLPKEAVVSLSVYDFAGRFVKSLLKEQRIQAGKHTVEFVDRQTKGKTSYMYVLNCDGFTAVRSMVKK